MPSAVPEDTEQEILLPSLTRNQPFPSQNRYLTHLSPLQPRPPILPQPSLPLMRGSTQLSLPSRQTLDPDIQPHTRSQLTVSLLRSTPVLTSEQTVKSPLSPNFEKYTPIPIATENAAPGLKRQKLNAIASGLADKDEFQTNGPANNGSPSRVYIEPNRSVPTEAKSSQDDTKDYVAPIMPQNQFGINPYLQDEFDDSEDVSYYVKETNYLFLPYCHPPKDVSPVSKWSLSSSAEMDLVNKRSSPSKSLKSKAVKFWSFISRFSSNTQPSSSDKHALSSAIDVPEKSICRQRSHSDLVESVAGYSSVSLQTPAFTYGLWNCVSPTPTTALSKAGISSSSHSPATPNNHRVDFDDQVSSGRRRSNEKLATRKSVSSIRSPVPVTTDSSSSLTWSGKDVSIANNAVDTPVAPLKHTVSTASMKTYGFKNLVFRIGLGDVDDSQEEGSGGRKDPPKETEKPPTSVPCTFRKRTILKHNSPAPSLILGERGNNTAKTTKAKRKLLRLIRGVEQDNYRKNEAISN